MWLCACLFAFVFWKKSGAHQLFLTVKLTVKLTVIVCYFWLNQKLCLFIPFYFFPVGRHSQRNGAKRRAHDEARQRLEETDREMKAFVRAETFLNKIFRDAFSTLSWIAPMVCNAFFRYFVICTCFPFWDSHEGVRVCVSLSVVMRATERANILERQTEW